MTRLWFVPMLVVVMVSVGCGGGSSVELEAAPATTSAGGEDGVPAGDGETARCGLTGRYDEVPCDEPHDAEFVGVVAAPDDPDNISAMAACGQSVEDFTDRPSTSFGIDVGFAPLEGTTDIECWAEVSAEDTLSASIREEGLDAALGDFVFVTDLEIGTCHVLADPQEDSFDIATVSECDADGAQVVFGRFEAADGPPPDDDTVDGFFDRCEDLASQDSFALPDEWYLISPLDSNWEALGRRTVLCVAPSAAARERDPSAQVGPVCAVFDADAQDYPVVPCDEPHSAEFVGSVDPPSGNLPADREEARALLNRVCREPVETYTDRSLARFGSGAGFVVEAGLGEPIVDQIRCYVSVPLDGAFTDAIGDVGYDAALAHEIVGDLEAGTCFVFVDDSVAFGEVVSCDTRGALVHIGGFEAADPVGSPYPGVDALRDERAERCEQILARSGLEVDPVSLSGTIPDEEAWDSFDLRQVTCDATPT